MGKTREVAYKTSKKQKQIIHILEHQLIRKGLLDEKGYRLILMGLFGKESSKDISHDEASLLIDQLLKMGGEITPGHVRAPARRLREESSIEGLRREVIQLARERYGEAFERPLVSLCSRLGINDYTQMDVRHAKAIKETLMRLQAEGPYMPKERGES